MKVTDEELTALRRRYGAGRLGLAADIASETWRRERGRIHNPGGYLHSLCMSLVVPGWYVPREERAAAREEKERRMMKSRSEKAAFQEEEELLRRARDNLWDSFSEERRQQFRDQVRRESPLGPDLPAVMIEARAKALPHAAQTYADRVAVAGNPAG